MFGFTLNLDRDFWQKLAVMAALTGAAAALDVIATGVSGSSLDPSVKLIVGALIAAAIAAVSRARATA